MLKPVLIFHLITRAMIIGALLIASAFSERTFPEVVMRWDGRWYRDLATIGYPSELPFTATGEVASNTAAFFPLFPLLARGLMSLGMPFWLGGMIINLLASTGAVLIIVLVGAQYLERRTAQLLGCLWTAFPVSVVLTVTYTEALFTLLGAASLLFLLRHDWIRAGIFAALASTTRPTGLIFAGAVALGAVEAILRSREWRSREWRNREGRNGEGRNREWRSLIGAAIAPLGFVGCLVGIGLYAGRLDAWQVTQRDGWYAELSFGAGWLDWFDLTPETTRDVIHLLTALMAVVLLILTIITVVLRPPLPIIGLILVGAFAAFAFDGISMHAAPRVMMTFFPVLAPLAILLNRVPRPVQWIILGFCSIIAALIGGYYFAFAPLPP